MYEAVEAILAEAREALAQLTDPGEIHQLRVEFLGRKGKLTQALRGLAALPAQDRPQAGSVANAAKAELENLISQKLQKAMERQNEARWERERVDVTLPGHPLLPGVPHVLVETRQQIEDIFIGLGFSIAEGPEVETDAYNFVALNIPKWHPARDMQATFYTGPDQVLRTHTSPVQIRSMRDRAPGVPLRVIAPGRVYRRDPADSTHLPVFTQIEGLVVDVDVTMADLCGVLLEWARQFFGPATRVRLSPSYFPFTEPSAEVEVAWPEGWAGRVEGRGPNWLEVAGAGMVHPQVLANGGYDPERVRGFAFGMGVERVAMLKYGIDDIRLFLQNDLRFLGQFRSI